LHDHFFEHFSAGKEAEQAQNLARAAKTAAVRHAIWSTAPDSRNWLSSHGSRLPEEPDGHQVPHWDGKARCRLARARLALVNDRVVRLV
jgi:hypothetical protein